MRGRLAVLTITVLLAAAASADDSGSILVTVTGPGGSAVAGADVTVSSASLIAPAGTVLTDMAGGTGAMALDNDAILEEEVITSGVPAEYPGGAGFVASIVTKPGGPAAIIRPRWRVTPRGRIPRP